MKRTKTISTIILIVSLLALTLVGCGKTSEVNSQAQNDSAQTGSKPEVINIAIQAIPNDEIVAKAKNWYESELGVKVNFRQFDSGRDVNTAMLSGGIDIGLVGSTPATLGIANGIPYEVFWIHDVIGDNEALAAKNDAKINSVKDLKGKKVAVPAGSTTHYSLLKVLSLEGVNAADVKILDMQPPDIFAAWQRGDIDAAYVWQPTLDKLLSDGKIIVTSKELAGKGIVTADVGIVRTEFAEKYPDLVKKYIQLQLKAYDLYQNNAEEAAQAVAKELNLEYDDSLKQMNELIWLSGEEQISDKYLGTSTSKGEFVKALKDTADFLAEQKTIDSAPGIEVFEKAVNPKYIEEALK
ncbi:aliphatic sulfonate ABC transporter substrate-binding protein [Clostridium aminobutyricum]|uniref:Aliphatic sulfonate ABC transporter substrate-binding protein n=1 Tax=Clostridium aminobutyricum TaxID=33953 RepID=A0A939IGV0_CLOAM|nr:aliphatic sulfonate ABC transporter substrate-binding protein [Clostridium aminobutyricum]MBN7773980.1 aliphatic sulfonate ABC transporter substrate-binding protein [Clostridium aminobutyricum]